uniref:Ribosomal RNA small subunit methyltransferase A n=1 Tax=candidate division CPR3 bacterium TaxID=2268181 RepID=A0A7C4M629_UNCC3
MTYKPKKQLGQNFLSDKKILMKIVESVDIKKDDTILEIGPGQGSLTYHLAQKAGKVIAVEKDTELVEYLGKKFENLKNLEIINDDILNFLESGIKNHELWNKKYIIIGNIPYYLTSFLLRKIFEIKNKPSEIVLMVQKEVAERMVAKPLDKTRGKQGEMNLLAISVQIFAEPEILFYVSKNSFWPKPKVDSAVIKISNFKNKISNLDPEKFMVLIKAGFSAKRKLLVNNLSKSLDIPKEKIYDIFRVVGLDFNVRAQDLSLGDWDNIYKQINF